MCNAVGAKRLIGRGLRFDRGAILLAVSARLARLRLANYPWRNPHVGKTEFQGNSKDDRSSGH